MNLAKGAAAAQESGALLTAGLLGGTLVLAVAGVGSPLRLLFPLASLLLAVQFTLSGRREALLELTVWLFMVTPGIRRIVDLSAGWDVVNTLMLAPYTAAITYVLPALKGLTDKRFRYGFPFVILLLCVLYGLVLAVVDGRVFGGGFDSLRWAVPPCVGLVIALEPERREAYRDVFVRALLFGIVALSCYGLYQFIVVPPWDAFWMRNVEMNSIGTPYPFLVRVFSLMNAPGSFAVFLMCGILMILPVKGWLRWPALALGGAVILLTLVRSSWLGLVLGFAYMVPASRGVRVKGSILGAVLALGLALPILAQIPEVQVALGDRLTSLTELSGDGSAEERTNGYVDFFNIRLAKDPFGIGLGSSGTLSTYADQGEATIMDGAVIEVGTSMGVIGGTLYFVAVAILVLVSVRAGFKADDGFTTGCAASVLAETAMLTSGTTTTGEMGLFFWVGVGFCLSSRQLQLKPMTLRRTPPARHSIVVDPSAPVTVQFARKRFES